MSLYSRPMGKDLPKVRGNKGVALTTKRIKRQEAEERNARTPLERTRQYRLSQGI